MQPQKDSAIVRPQATVAMILGTANPQSANRPIIATARGASSNPPAIRREPAKKLFDVPKRNYSRNISTTTE